MLESLLSSQPFVSHVAPLEPHVPKNKTCFQKYAMLHNRTCKLLSPHTNCNSNVTQATTTHAKLSVHLLDGKNHSSHKACLVVWLRYQRENFPSSRKLRCTSKTAVTTLNGQLPIKLSPCTKKTARLFRKLPDRAESIQITRKWLGIPKLQTTAILLMIFISLSMSLLSSSDIQLFTRSVRGPWANPDLSSPGRDIAHYGELPVLFRSITL